MKKHIRFILSIVVILMCFMMVVHAAEETAVPKSEISAFNLSFNDSVYIKIYAWDIEGSDVKMLVWKEAQESYTLGTEDALLEPVGSQTVSGKKNQVFDYNGLAAKQMADTVYFRAYAEVDGEVVYSAVKKYSILQYVYNKLGKTGTETEDENLKILLADMLTYGASAQTYFQYNTDRLATAAFYQVKVVGGLLADGCDNGLYLPGDKVTLTAPQTNAEGEVFSHWASSAGTKVSETTSFELTVTEQNEIYTAVYGNAEEKPSEGLKYIYLSDSDSYKVSGIGSCTDTDIVIPSTYKDKPVTSIGGQAFGNCTSLTSITIPNSVTSIGTQAFSNCSSLTSITIPNSVTSIGNSAFYHTAYYNNTSHWTDGVLYIGKHLIKAQNEALPANYTVKEGTICIADGSFSSCTSLTSITIPNSVTSIGSYAFADCRGLTSIEIPDSVTSIGTQAFSNCSSLTSITIPNTVTSIGNRAFYHCTGLTNITIPNSVTSIGSYAFEGCSSLTSIEIPDSVTSIGDGAFAGCRGLTNITIPNNVTSIGSYAFKDCSFTSIVIPAGVTRIGNYAFQNCTDLTNITISNSVTSIGNGAFAGCTSLASITIPNSVTSIGTNPFADCRGLTSITVDKENTVYHSMDHCIIKTEAKTLIAGCNSSKIPSDGSVTSIGDYAFQNCTELTSIEIPAGVTSIGIGAFAGCRGLTSITVDKENTVYHSMDHCIIETETKTLITGCNSSKIPSDGSVTSIGNFAFRGCGFTSIEIPDSVTSIGNYAFNGCSSLTSVTIPNSVTSIGDGAFGDCKSLTSITFHGTKEEWDKIRKGSWWNDNAGNYEIIFKEDELLPSEGLAYTYLSDSDSYAVSGIGSCTDTDIVIPSTYNGKPVTSIGNYAFAYCSSLTSITIPNSVQSIGSEAIPNAFVGCAELTSITVDAENPVYHAVDDCLIETATKTLITGCQNSIIPTDGSVTSIGNYAFGDCDGLTSITIPTGVQRIGVGAFSSCTSLTSITIPNTVTSIDSGAFDSCKSLASITIPTGVTTIASSAFSSCQSLTTVTIPTGVESIESSAFASCKNLTSVTIPTGVIKIGDSAFYQCKSLTSITIPTGVKTIGNYAFEGCQGLANITIPSSVTTIGYRAFQNTAYYNNASHWTDGVLYIGNHLIKAQNEALPANYTVKEGTICIANKAFYSCQGLTTITIPTGVQSIGYATFENCKGLTTITLPNGVQSIGDFAFASCENLTSILIPNSVTSIGSLAFTNCTSLTQITIPSSVTSIGNSAFNLCTNLNTITVDKENTVYHSDGNCIIETATKTLTHGCGNSTIPADGSVTVIGDGAFLNCGFTSIVIPSGVTKISEGAFYQCQNLRDITISNTVTTIYNEAFAYCTNLTSITIPSSVTRIVNYVFSGCENLTRILFQGTKAEWDAISKGSKWDDGMGDYTITFTEGASTELSYTYLSASDSYSVSGIGSCTDSDILISSTYHDKPVTSIGDFAFYHYTSMTSIAIPNSVKSIGNYAFYHCQSLTTITFQGTKAEWNRISKGDFWNYNTGAYTIHCTDGTISK